MAGSAPRYRPLCGNCDQEATYGLACGHFYCETCSNFCYPITQRFDKKTGCWIECREEEGEVSHVNITVEGVDSREVEAVEKAIGQMMHEKFESFRSEVVSSVGFDRDF